MKPIKNRIRLQKIYKFLPLIYICFVVSLISSCGQKNGSHNDSSTALSETKIISMFSQGNGVTDFDGNDYETARIGDQEWMAENLRVTHYRDGTSIEYPGTDYSAWQENKAGAYAWYDHDKAKFKETYGALYNWFAVNNQAGLCPNSWRVPSDDDWKRLEMNLGMSEDDANSAGWRGSNITSLLKSTRIAPDDHPRWDNVKGSVSNESGFSAIPGGYRTSHGLFVYIGLYGHWWTATEYTSSFAWSRRLEYDSNNVTRFALNKVYGYSVRCMKDQ